MSKRKNPENATASELLEHKAKEIIANHATRSEKTAWQRQYDNLAKIVKHLEPIEDKMLELTAKRDRYIDELIVLRRTLADDCVHPYEMLVVHDDLIVCKFCERKMRIPGNDKVTDHSGEDQTHPQANS